MARTKRAPSMPTTAQIVGKPPVLCVYWKCPCQVVVFGRDGGMTVRACGHADRPKAGIDLMGWPYEFAPRECPRRTS